MLKSGGCFGQIVTTGKMKNLIIKSAKRSEQGQGYNREYSPTSFVQGLRSGRHRDTEIDERGWHKVLENLLALSAGLVEDGAVACKPGEQ